MRATQSAGALACIVTLAACGAQDEGGSTAPQVARAISTSVCSPLTYGGQGSPRFVVPLVAPLQNAYGDHGIQNTQAIKLVMQQHGWRAGPHAVAIQVCDEASAGSFSDVTKCKRNARLFAENPSVVAVVGPTTSSCAAAMLPALNGARSDPIALVGIGNTYLGLTRHGPGVESGDPERLYPSGERSYLRTVPADDAQAAAGVLIARSAGARKPFAVHDGSAYGRGQAAAFQQAARNTADMAPAGTARWDPQAGGYSVLARRIRRLRADVVYVAGNAINNGPRLLRDLRGELGSEVLIVGGDGFSQSTALVEGAGELAEGFTVTLPAAPVQALPSAGRRWAAEFRRRWGAQPCCYAVHAGQVTQLVLDAIAHSDGSRADVLRNLRRATVVDGLVGDFHFDTFGDTTLTTISQYVIQDGRLRYVRTVDVPRSLLARE